VSSLIRAEFYKKYENRKEGGKLDQGEAYEVNWYFHMPIPKSFNQFKKNACKWGFIEHISKPDRSNLEKFYEDCANGILWHDDSQITKGSIIKKYCSDDNPRTEIYMQPIKEPDEDVKEIVSLFSPEEISTICYDASKINMVYEKLPQIASFLSKLADQHAKKLSKINKSYPGYWKKFESNSSFLQY
jgi:Holliday junction resolvase RusA-like endonuclease